MAELVRKGAVGDVVGRYIDADGNIVDPGLDERTVGLGLDQLRPPRPRSSSSPARAKHDVARAVVTSGLCTVLVTDEDDRHEHSGGHMTIEQPCSPLAPAERAVALLGGELDRAQPAPAPRRPPGRRRRRPRAARRRARHPLDQDHLEEVGARPHHRADRPDDARGCRHPRQGALAGREGDDPGSRPTRHPAGRRGLRLRRHGAGCRGGPRCRPRRSRRRPHLGRRRRDRLPQRPGLAAREARRHGRRRRRRRRRDRHGHRPRRLPRRPLRPGLRRDRRRQGGLPPRRRQRTPTSR